MYLKSVTQQIFIRLRMGVKLFKNFLLMHFHSICTFCEKFSKYIFKSLHPSLIFVLFALIETSHLLPGCRDYFPETTPITELVQLSGDRFSTGGNL